MATSKQTPGADRGRPLDGVVVVDLTRQMSGPYASMVLGDFGAEVIKVESAPRGDGARHIGNTFIGGESTMFLTWNRNKRSICVDLRSEEGRAVLRRLVDDADVVMENFRPGVAEEMGVGAADVLARNPRAVYCSINAFGSVGPWSRRPGTDPVVQAMSGVMSVTGERDGDPVLVGIPVADFSSAMLAVQGILLALIARERTGRGQRVEIPMLHALVFGLTTRVGPFFANGEDPGRWGNQHSQVVPYQAFKTKDGYAVAGTWGEKDWPGFCDALGCPGLASDPRFATNVERVARRDVLTPLLQERFLDRTTAEWEEIFSSRGVLFAPVNTFSEVFDHPQSQALGLVAEVEHPTAGVQKQVAPAVRLEDTPAAIARPSPLLGQHSREILMERGWSEDQVEELVAAGVLLEPSRISAADS
jgi:crotonobetainyl-CoA:carnitine CoA-transferase CaiB-like acyl-CoA transferase